MSYLAYSFRSVDFARSGCSSLLLYKIHLRHHLVEVYIDTQWIVHGVSLKMTVHPPTIALGNRCNSFDEIRPGICD